MPRPAKHNCTHLSTYGKIKSSAKTIALNNGQALIQYLVCRGSIFIPVKVLESLKQVAHKDFEQKILRIYHNVV